MSESLPAHTRTTQELEGRYIETPLHYYLGTESGQYKPEIEVCESELKGHLILRGDPDCSSFVQGVESAVGVKLPTEACTWESNEGTSIYWLGPDEWLLITDGGMEIELEQRLRETLTGHISVVDVSGGQTLITITGDSTELLLRKSGGYDFHSDHFKVGKCIQTNFAKATALVVKRSESSIDLVIRRSFADYLARWLLDAASEFGCRVTREA